MAIPPRGSEGTLFGDRGVSDREALFLLSLSPAQWRNSDAVAGRSAESSPPDAASCSSTDPYPTPPDSAATHRRQAAVASNDPAERGTPAKDRSFQTDDLSSSETDYSSDEAVGQWEGGGGRQSAASLPADADDDDDADTDPPDVTDHDPFSFAFPPHSVPDAERAEYRHPAAPAAVEYLQMGRFKVNLNRCALENLRLVEDVLLPLADNLQEARARGAHILLDVRGLELDGTSALSREFTRLILDPLCAVHSRYLFKTLVLNSPNTTTRAFSELCRKLARSRLQNLAIKFSLPCGLSHVQQNSGDWSVGDSQDEAPADIIALQSRDTADVLVDLLKSSSALRSLRLTCTTIDPTQGLRVIDAATRNSSLQHIKVWLDVAEVTAASLRSDQGSGLNPSLLQTIADKLDAFSEAATERGMNHNQRRRPRRCVFRRRR